MATKAKKVQIQEKVVITEAELWRVRKARSDLTAANRAAKAAKAAREQLEMEIMDKLQRGAVIEGKLTAGIDEQLGDCRPPWKDLYLDHMESDHGITKAAAEEEARTDHPAKLEKVLVIGEKE